MGFSNARCKFLNFFPLFDSVFMKASMKIDSVLHAEIIVVDLKYYEGKIGFIIGFIGHGLA